VDLEGERKKRVVVVIFATREFKPQRSVAICVLVLSASTLQARGLPPCVAGFVGAHLWELVIWRTESGGRLSRRMLVVNKGETLGAAPLVVLVVMSVR
jgi:hypothetical protein